MQINRPEKEERPRLLFGDRQPVRNVRGNSYTDQMVHPAAWDDMQWRQSLDPIKMLFLKFICGG